MKTYREYIETYRQAGMGIGHFNISTVEVLWAIIEAANEASASEKIPVIIGVSEGERDFIGVKQAVALVKSIRDSGEYPVFINADHTYSLERVKEAIDAGFDSAIFDGAKLSTEENIATTKACVAYAQKSGRDVLVEGELGYIGTSSKLLDEIPEGAAQDEMLTTSHEAIRYVTETGVDLFAPAVGNLHGKLKNSPNPRLNISRINEISEATGVPLVLHGGSGVSDDDFVSAVKAGMNIVHINTEIRVAWKDALVAELAQSSEVAPYKLLSPSKSAVKEVVQQRINLFANN
ncbi:MAG: class II fructose-bisphosphate aldolase [bacterium]|nr:class II fructose-bisphosphate aldolase [bacterium]